MSIERLRLRTIEQSVTQIGLSLADLTGVLNQLLYEHQMHPLAHRAQRVCQQIEGELDRIQYVIEQGAEPASQAQLELGLKVQDAVNEISQI